MRIVISGTEYSMSSLNKLTLWDTLELERQTGMTLDAFSERVQVMETSGTTDLEVVCAIVWMARRKAGEKLTFEQACDFPLDELEMLPDPEDEAAAAAADPPAA